MKTYNILIKGNPHNTFIRKIRGFIDSLESQEAELEMLDVFVEVANENR